MRTWFALAFVAAVTLAGCGDESSTVRVLAASSLTEVFGDIASDFEASNPGIDVDLVFGGSAVLAAQIEEGIDFDVVALADEATMQRVEATGQIRDPTVFATNDAVLVTGADLAGTRLDELDHLTVAVCAAEVPCGRAAVELLAALDIDIEPVTFETNVLGVVAKLTLDEVDAGVIYATDLVRVSDELVPLDAAADVRVTNQYPAAVRADAAAAEGADARRFLTFLTGPEAQRRLRVSGFGAP